MSGLRIFPLGTSRLHWPLEYIAKHHAAEVLFPGLGYFQSAAQIAHVASYLADGCLGAPSKYVFRRDASPSNAFDERLWDERGHEVDAPARRAFAIADVLAIEVSSPIDFLLDKVAVQGNPNHERNVPFADIWRTGYYAVHEPELQVSRVEADDQALLGALRRIDDAAGGRPVVCLSHIYRDDRDFGRAAFAARVHSTAESLGWRFIDAASHCQRDGFRSLADGSIDIHHLAWPGARRLAAEILQTACMAAEAEAPQRELKAILDDVEEMTFN